jgi:hypothetical protein
MADIELSKANKTEAVQVRFDAKGRFTLEMTARRFNMPLATLVEQITTNWLASHQQTIVSDVERAFSPFVADRFVMQATVFPDTLTDLERLLWARIKREDALWISDDRSRVTADNFDFETLRSRWEEFCKETLDCKEVQEFHNHLLKTLKVRNIKNG